MKIVFLGDSITKGIPGVSYFNMLKVRLAPHQLVNQGKGGDTVLSLNRRMKAMRFPSDTDLVFLCVGINDVLVKVSNSYPVIKRLLNQPWAKSIDEFRCFFKDTLDYLSDNSKRIAVVPPLLIGEDIHNAWNSALNDLIAVVRGLSKSLENADYLDMRSRFTAYLEGRQISEYVPRSMLSGLYDVVALRAPQTVDAKSSKRGLHLTLDGVHLNSTGAGIVAGCIEQYVKAFNTDCRV